MKTHRNLPKLITSLCLAFGVTTASAATVPEPFRGHDPDSLFRIQYADIDVIFGTMVVDVGRSTREVAEPPKAPTGTRVKYKVKRSTAKEGNRFYFEEFEENEDYRAMLHEVRKALEEIPGNIPMSAFSRKEQLAYWLNLYNVTLVDELVKIYPEKDLKKELTGRKSILDEKLVNIDGVQLSLNDIQHTILAQNYDNDPMIMYGLFQGVVGGPNIRKQAYTSANVEQALRDNATEFINSNRGTFSRDGDFEVSTMYEINQHLFPDFQADLKTHLMAFIEGPERTDLQGAGKLDPDIDDWSVADIYGTYRNVGGSFSTSKAALMDGVIASQPDGSGGTMVTNASATYAGVMSKTLKPSEFTPEVQDLLRSIHANENAGQLVRQGRVTVEEMGTRPGAENETETEE